MTRPFFPEPGCSITFTGSSPAGSVIHDTHSLLSQHNDNVGRIVEQVVFKTKGTETGPYEVTSVDVHQVEYEHRPDGVGVWRVVASTIHSSDFYGTTTYDLPGWLTITAVNSNV